VAAVSAAAAADDLTVSCATCGTDSAGGMGSGLDGLTNPGVGAQQVTSDLVSDSGFSQKPSPDGYADYYDKVVYYVAILAGPAQALDQFAYQTIAFK
jgi:hypothetical protein